MRRYRQTVEQILERLSVIKSSWRDNHADRVIAALDSVPDKGSYALPDVGALLDNDFSSGITAVRLFLDLSKDEFQMALRDALGAGGIGITRYKQDRSAYLAALKALGILRSLRITVNTPVTWRDLLAERLKGGRGSAIKGQARGRYLEDFTERIVAKVFHDVGYEARCRFTGARGTSTEKADFAIPARNDARILIEVKAYGATGSKQTDILGDIARIVEEKRHDTNLLLVTDGITWKARINDLRNLVAMQNRGLIARIYTSKMSEELGSDLAQLRRDHNL